MPIPSLLAVYLLVASLSLHLLAFLLYRHYPRSSELRDAAVITFTLGVALLALVSLLWMEISLTVQTAAQAPAPAYAESAEGDSGEEQ